uniref:EF-hand domain-containing protein n=1 Tax=Panagrellus redivivus TaxID=6233 RepID=A0A7E4UVD2_PANRE
MSLEDKLRRDTFKMAYFTEIGATNRLIDKEEFHDLAVCAGIDVQSSAIDEAWPSDKKEINMEEAYHLFTRLPNLELRIKHALESLERETQEKEPLPFEVILEKCKALYKFNETKKALNNVNQTLCERAKHGIFPKDFGQDHVLNGMLPPLEMNFSDAESSVFLDEPALEDDGGGGLLSHDARSLSERPISSAIEGSSRKASSAMVDEPYTMMKTTRRSLVIQREIGPTSLKHIFTLTEIRNVKIQVSVNVRLDPDLCRFENAIHGVLQRHESGKIVAVTVKKSGNTISTDRLTLLPATYSFTVAFCRSLSDMKASSTEKIIDDKKKLTAKYRMCVMNIFDMFDLNEDQTLDYKEFRLYNQMSGGGDINKTDWDSLLEQLTTKNGGLSMKSFVALHQEEADTYENDNFDDMYLSLKQLGFNGKFAITNTCPVIIDYLASDEEIVITSDESYHFDGTFAEQLAEFFWSQSTVLPYLKNLPLRMWMSDYFGVLMAGVTNTPNHYHLNLNGSQNVNLDVGKDMIIEETVPPYACKILATGIAVDTKHKWFISVRRVRSDQSATSSANPSRVNSVR